VAGQPAAAALAGTVAAVQAAGLDGRFNFLLTDGRVIAATAAGDTLFYRRQDDAVVVASEPGDDEPGWAEVPGDSVVTATAGQVSVTPLALAGVPAAADEADQNTDNGRISLP
jgi:glutamine amidotransferase